MSAQVVRRDVVVARLDDLKERERIVVDVEGTELGVYFYADEVRAWYNVCPHQGGPVCQGKMMPRTVQLVRGEGGLKSGGPGFHPTDRNIVCPWHGFEFDVLTGKHPADHSVGLRPVPVRVDRDDVVVTLRPPPVAKTQIESRRRGVSASDAPRCARTVWVFVR